MGAIRKDSKGRNLKEGESQRKDGLYMYRYNDPLSGKRVTIYDRDLAVLRQKEKEISSRRLLGYAIDPSAQKTTLNDLFDKYLSTHELDNSIRLMYIKRWNKHVRGQIGNARVSELKPSDMKAFYSELGRRGYASGTIKGVHLLVTSALNIAVDDGIIPKNPATKGCSGVGTAPQKRVALTVEQQNSLITFVKNDWRCMKYYPMIEIMLGTCCRCGELAGLTWEDIDFNQNLISIDRQVTYRDYGNGYEFRVIPPKTEAGIRKIPMTNAVRKAFLEQRVQNIMLGLTPSMTVDGYSNFVFLTHRGKPYNTKGVNYILDVVVKAHNAKETKNAAAEKRNPILLPHISAHVMRHTGCTRLFEKKVDIKTIQYIMGHSDVTLTLNIYTHVVDLKGVVDELAIIEV